MDRNRSTTSALLNTLLGVRKEPEAALGILPSAPEGPRNVATGGAKRNPWSASRIWCPAPKGRRKRSAIAQELGFAAFVVIAILLIAPTIALGQEKPKNADPPKPDDLGSRLIRKAATDGEEDLMDAIVRLMNEAARKVEIEFDPGPETQAMQQSIQTKLDEAIKAAASRQRSRQVAPPADPDRRRMPPAKRDTTATKPPQRTEPQPSSTSSTVTGTQEARPDEADPGELRDVRRGWGHLPQREREEIIQGAGEGFLERYRAWVERYYRALQEKDQ